MEDDPLSISALVDRFGIDLYVYRPSVSTGNDGEVALSFAKAYSARGFIQPTSQTSDVAQGRENGRTTATIYFTGSVDVRIDDEIRNAESGTYRLWRVVGAVNPGEVGVTYAAPHLSMTAVDCIEVEPELST